MATPETLLSFQPLCFFTTKGSYHPCFFVTVFFCPKLPQDFCPLTSAPYLRSFKALPKAFLDHNSLCVVLLDITVLYVYQGQERCTIL